MKYFWNKLLLRRVAVGIFYLSLSSASIASPNLEGIQVYQKNLHESPERKQSLAADIDRYNNAENIWDTLREEFTLPHYEDNARVQEQIEWFMNNQDFLYRSAYRAAPYLYYILQQVRMRHLPAEVALLPVLESSFNPFASSPVGAAGIWQMMPDTASGFGIKHNSWYDGRRDVVASTKAALNYLAYLSDFFNGNWMYAIAAYNTGEGNVLAAIKKNVRYGDSTDFWSLPVAQETRDYIPKLLALATIISHPEQYPVQLPFVKNAPYLAQVDIGAQIDLKHAATLAGLSLKQFKQLNPAYNRSATDPNGHYKLVLPIESVEQFTEKLSRSPLFYSAKGARYKPGDALQEVEDTESEKNTIVARTTPSLSKTILNSKQIYFSDASDDTARVKHKLQQVTQDNNDEYSSGHYTLQPGDTLYMVRNGDDVEKIAQRFHASAKMIRLANNFKNKDVSLHPGQQVVIPTHASTNDDTESRKFQLNPGDTLYMVRKGDTLEKIARKYHTTASALRVANLISSNEVTEGDQIVVPTKV
jgi:membrane-bound lytic murein transglycosylase D